jgi:hypothetical protein
MQWRRPLCGKARKVAALSIPVLGLNIPVSLVRFRVQAHISSEWLHLQGQDTVRNIRHQCAWTTAELAQAAEQREQTAVEAALVSARGERERAFALGVFRIRAGTRQRRAE